MNYSLSKTNQLLSYFKEESQRYDATSEMITMIFPRYIIVSFYAECEVCITQIINEKIRKNRNDDVTNYCDKMIRKTHNNDLQKIIEAFKNKEVYKKFAVETNKIQHNIQPLQYFNECVQARGTVAHHYKNETQKGWNEVQNIIVIGEYVLSKFAEFIK